MRPADDIPDKRLARHSFGLAARQYDQAAVLQREVGDRLQQRLDLVRLEPRRVLDLGAGTGHCVDGLLSRYRKAEVVALDIALPMLLQARRRGRWLRRPRCICADAESLPFADGSFELVFSNLMLQWVVDLEAAFREVRRVLRPGGLWLFTSFGPDTLKELRASWAQVDEYVHVNRFLDMHDVGDALLQTGFCDPVMDVERLTVTYPDAWQLMRELKMIGAHNVTTGRPRGLTGKQRMQKLVRAYQGYRIDGVLPASYEIVNGHAWRGGHELRVSVESVKRR